MYYYRIAIVIYNLYSKLITRRKKEYQLSTDDFVIILL